MQPDTSCPACCQQLLVIDRPIQGVDLVGLFLSHLLGPLGCCALAMLIDIGLLAHAACHATHTV